MWSNLEDRSIVARPLSAQSICGIPYSAFSYTDKVFDRYSKGCSVMLEIEADPTQPADLQRFERRLEVGP